MGRFPAPSLFLLPFVEDVGVEIVHRRTGLSHDNHMLFPKLSVPSIFPHNLFFGVGRTGKYESERG